MPIRCLPLRHRRCESAQPGDRESAGSLYQGHPDDPKRTDGDITVIPDSGALTNKDKDGDAETLTHADDGAFSYTVFNNTEAAQTVHITVVLDGPSTAQDATVVGRGRAPRPAAGGCRVRLLRIQDEVLARRHLLAERHLLRQRDGDRGLDVHRRLQEVAGLGGIVSRP